jgi:mono/diheme cytochrome c family protein
MRFATKRLHTLLLVGCSVLVFGCGEKETNAPSVKLSASVVTSSADTSAHTHTIAIPFTDISASPASDVFQYRSGIVNGHSHVIAITKQQMIDLNNGMRLVLTSSASDTGASHTHSWSVQGGNLLYEKNCYNCHSNDKRGHSPMNVSFNSSQTTSVMNPNNAPQSISASAVPDPNYSTSPAVVLDGVVLYNANCSSCHSALASSTKSNKTLTQIKNAISGNSGGMSSLGSLSDAQIQAIANALVK